MGFKQSSDLDLYEKERKKMGLGRRTDLKSYENKGIEAERLWVSSKVQIWTSMKKKEKRWGWAILQI